MLVQQALEQIIYSENYKMNPIFYPCVTKWCSGNFPTHIILSEYTHIVVAGQYVTCGAPTKFSIPSHIIPYIFHL
jgi:hypothetical protein